jgi:nucleotide-binding universal stress UspA family protein
LDGSDAAHHALERALELASVTGAAVHLLSVEEHLPHYAATVGEVAEEERFESRYFQELQDEAIRMAHMRHVPITRAIVPGHAAEVMVREAADQGCDLVVVGHTGHSRLHMFFLGSTADRVVEHARCPVLVVR